MDGFFGGGATGRVATVRSGPLGAAGAGWVCAVCCSDCGGAVWGVTLREIGRGFGSGTPADAPCDAKTATAAPSTNVLRSAARTPEDGARNDVTANLGGESCNAARLQVYWIDYVDKTSNVLEPVPCRNTTAKSRLMRPIRGLPGSA